jgi:hypothetical protein
MPAAGLVILAACAAAPPVFPGLPPRFRVEREGAFGRRDSITRGDKQSEIETKIATRIVAEFADVSRGAGTATLLEFRSSWERLGKLSASPGHQPVTVAVKWTPTGALVVDAGPGEPLRLLDLETLTARAMLEGASLEPGSSWTRTLADPSALLAASGDLEDGTARITSHSGSTTARVTARSGNRVTVELTGASRAQIDIRATAADAAGSGTLEVSSTLKATWIVDAVTRLPLERTEESTTVSWGGLGEVRWRRTAVDRVSTRLRP